MLMGIGTESPFNSIQDYVQMVLNKQPLHLKVPDGRFDFSSDSAIHLPCFMLTQNEKATPYHRPWLLETQDVHIL